MPDTAHDAPPRRRKTDKPAADGAGVNARNWREHQDPILRYFTYAHLPPHLRAVSEKFAELAFDLAESLPKCEERSAGLRKLLEAKDCAVRCLIP